VRRSPQFAVPPLRAPSRRAAGILTVRVSACASSSGRSCLADQILTLRFQGASCVRSVPLSDFGCVTPSGAAPEDLPVGDGSALRVSMTPCSVLVGLSLEGAGRSPASSARVSRWAADSPW